MAGLVIRNVNSLREPSLAIFDVVFPSGIIFRGCILRDRFGDGSYSVAPPRAAIIDGEGVARRNGAGRIEYRPTVSFADDDTHQRFTESVLAALRDQAPTAFDPGRK